MLLGILNFTECCFYLSKYEIFKKFVLFHVVMIFMSSVFVVMIFFTG